MQQFAKYTRRSWRKIRVAVLCSQEAAMTVGFLPYFKAWPYFKTWWGDASHDSVSYKHIEPFTFGKY